MRSGRDSRDPRAAHEDEGAGLRLGPRPDGRWSDWDDDEPDGNDDRYTVGEILDSTLEIVPAAGEALRFDLTVSDAEIVEVTPTAELEPYGSEYTGYMGNWGNTMDRWYRRAALVIWPHTRAFAIRAKGDPAAAIGDLLERPATDESSADRARGRRYGDPVAGLDRCRPPRRPALVSTRSVAARLATRR